MKLSDYWVPLSIGGALAYGIFASAMTSVNDVVKNDSELLLNFTYYYLFYTGIFGVILIAILLGTDSTLYSKMIKEFDWKYIILTSFLGGFLSNVFHLIAMNTGGSVSQQIINLNIVFVSIGGVLVHKEKFNRQMVIGILICLLGGYLITVGKDKI
jgi:drug/metabolite transporter (DMT)-like permease